MSNESQISSSKCGCLLDELSGENLAYANIFSSDSTIAVSTNEKGIFKLPADLDGDQIFNISYLGFENMQFQYKDLSDCNNAQTHVIKLKNAAFEIPYLIIKEYITDGIDLDENGQSTKLRPKYVGTLPGQTNPDIMRTIQFLPGVGSPSSKASDIYIRGGTPDQNLILWEDIPIYHSAHYFGMISSVDPYVISKMKIYRSGFDASYGGRIAGVIDINSFGLDDKDTFIGVGSDFVNTFVNGYQKLGRKKNSALSFSLRRSFADIWQSPTFKNISKFNQQGLILANNIAATNNKSVEINNKFNFLDAHLKFSQQLGKKTRFSLASLYADNNFADKIEDERNGDTQRDTMDLMNIGASFMLEHQWTSSLSSNVKGIANNYQYDYNLSLKDNEEDTPYLIARKSNRIVDRQLQFNSNYKFLSNKLLLFGYHFTNYDIEFNNKKESAKSQDFTSKGKTESQLHAGYINFKNPISEIIGIDAGVRINYYSKSNKSYIEPRLNISYQLLKSLSLHANYGKHHQFISQVTEFKGSENGFSTPLWALAENQSIPIQEANQYQLGFIFNKNNWVIDVQAYIKDIIGLSSRAYNFNVEENGNASIGKAEVKGIDVLLRKRINKNIKTWVSYTLSEVELSFRELSMRPFNADYDQRHTLKLASQFKFGSVEFGLGFNYSSGLPFTRIENYVAVNPPGEPWEFDINYAPINSNYLNQQFEVNLSGSFQHHFKNSNTKAILTASVINLLNQKNVYNRTSYVDAPKNQEPDIYKVEKENLPFTPNVSLRFEF